MLIKKITPTCLSAIKKKFSLTHIVMWCKSEEGQYIITTGSNPDNNVQAALMGNRFRTFLGWPKMSFAVAPKISDLMIENKKLKEENKRLRERLGIKEVEDEGNEVKGEQEEKGVRVLPEKESDTP